MAVPGPCAGMMSSGYKIYTGMVASGLCARIAGLGPVQRFGLGQTDVAENIALTQSSSLAGGNEAATVMTSYNYVEFDSVLCK